MCMCIRVLTHHPQAQASQALLEVEACAALEACCSTRSVLCVCTRSAHNALEACMKCAPVCGAAGCLGLCQLCAWLRSLREYAWVYACMHACMHACSIMCARCEGVHRPQHNAMASAEQ